MDLCIIMYMNKKFTPSPEVLETTTLIKTVTKRNGEYAVSKVLAKLEIHSYVCLYFTKTYLRLILKLNFYEICIDDMLMSVH